MSVSSKQGGTLLLEDTLHAVHAELRAAMNGIASKRIRESGMAYKLSYGVELPRLREIAAEFVPDRHLAQALWQENVRECQLLAILLYPIDEFDNDMADLWMDSLSVEHAELAGLLCMELLSHVPYGLELAFQGMADERPVRQLCGFLTLTRYIMQGAQLSPDAETEFMDQAAAALPTSYLPLRKAIQNALLHYGTVSEEAARKANRILGIV